MNIIKNIAEYHTRMKPKDAKLYERVKQKLYKDMPTHSAYRSGILVQRYKEAYKKKYGKRRSAYHGKKPQRVGLARWFKEEWATQDGSPVYIHKNDIFRPKKRITNKTPITHGELTKKEIKRARRTKRRVGRVNRFRKTTKK